jgi:hypothetical protein
VSKFISSKRLMTAAFAVAVAISAGGAALATSTAHADQPCSYTGPLPSSGDGGGAEGSQDGWNQICGDPSKGAPGSPPEPSAWPDPPTLTGVPPGAPTQPPTPPQDPKGKPAPPSVYVPPPTGQRHFQPPSNQ